MESDAIEGASSVQNILKPTINWFKEHSVFILFIKRFSIYFTLFIMAILIVWLLDPVINTGQILVDNARYSLSVLIQSQSAIIAIVITLTLVAVQTSATASSAKLVHYVIRKNPDVWILLVSYIAAILYGLWVLHNLTLRDPVISVFPTVAPEYENYILFVYGSGLFTLIMLIPYFWRITNLLRIDYLLNEISQEISEEMILKRTDSFLLFFELLQVSAVHFNFSGVSSGLSQIASRMIQLINTKNPEQSKKGLELIFNHLIYLGQVSSSAGNDESVSEIVQIMCAIGEYSIEQKETQFAGFSIRSLFLITKCAIDHKQYQSSLNGVHVIGLLGKLAEENGLFETADYAIDKLGEIGYFAANSQMEWTTTQVGDELTNIGIVAIDKEQRTQVENIFVSLNECLDEAIKWDLDGALKELIGFLGQMGVHSAERKNDICAANAVFLLGMSSTELGLKKRRHLIYAIIEKTIEIGNKSLNPISPKTLGAIAEISQLIIENTKNDSLFKTENHILPLLDLIGKSVANTEDLESSKFVLDAIGVSLEHIGRVNIKQRSYDSTYSVVDSLFEITKLLNERKFSELTSKYVKALSSLGLIAIREKFVSPLSLVSPPTTKLNEYLSTSELKLIEKDTPFFVIDRLIEIGIRSGELQQNPPLYHSIIGLAEIGEVSIDREYFSLVDKIIQGLIHIGLIAANQKIETATLLIISALKIIEESAEKHNQKIMIKQAASALLFVGIYNLANAMDKPKDYAISSLANIARKNEELITELIQMLDDNKEIADFDLFHNFVSEYEKKMIDLKSE